MAGSRPEGVLQMNESASLKATALGDLHIKLNVLYPGAYSKMCLISMERFSVLTTKKISGTQTGKETFSPDSFKACY